MQRCEGFFLLYIKTKQVVYYLLIYLKNKIMPQNTIVRQAATALAVTPSDGTAIVGASFNSPAALFVGTGGDITVITLGGSTVLLKNIANGTFLPVQVTHVKATGTDATDIVALF